MNTTPPATKRPKQACDVCRLRKRKCDGVRPICSPCMKTSRKHRDGAAQCGYSEGPAIRNSQTALSQALLSRLESVEAMLKPLTQLQTNVQAPVDERVKNLLVATEKVLSPSEIPQHRGNQYQKTNYMGNGYHTNNHFSAGFMEPDLSFFTDNAFIPKQSQPFIPTPVSIVPLSPTYSNEDDLENHLISLTSLFYIGSTFDSEERLVHPASRYSTINQRDIQLSHKLKNAMFFHAVFVSNHPQLFGNLTTISFADRLRVAEVYKLHLTTNVDVATQSHQEAYDDIRACLVHAMTLFCIGKTAEAITFISEAFQKGQAKNIFNPVTFSDTLDNSMITVDDLVSIMGNQNLIAQEKSLSKRDRKERYALWNMLMMVDTFASIATGAGFMMDESNYPDLHEVIGSKHPIQQPKQRKLKTHLAKNTIWEKSNLALMFDDLNETRHYFSGISFDFVEKEEFCMRNLRRAVRFSRSQKFKTNAYEAGKKGKEMHNEILVMLHSVPHGFNLIPSLEQFAPGNTAVDQIPSQLARLSVECCNGLLVNFAILTYVHLPLVQNKCTEKFALEAGKAEIYTPKDVMYATVRALEFMYKCGYIPLYPNDSPYGISEYDQNDLKNLYNLSLNPNVPSPLYACATSALISFIIASSALIAHRTEPVDTEVSNSLSTIVSTNILPCLLRNAGVWPAANYFALKLQDVAMGEKIYSLLFLDVIFSPIIWLTISLIPVGFLFPLLCFTLALSTFSLSLYRYLTRKPINWTNQTIVITGGSHGIGKQLVQKCLDKGSKVVVFDRIECPINHEHLVFRKCDLADKENVKKACVGINPTVLINNAGIVAGKLFKDADIEEIERTIQVNVLAHFYLLKQFLNDLVSISSVMGIVGAAYSVDYSCSKFAVAGYMESLRQDKVQVSTVYPGLVNTGMFLGVDHQYPYLTPQLETEMVVDKIIDILESGQGQEIYLPFYVKLTTALKIFPLEVNNLVRLITGANNDLKKYQGSVSKK
ncbi:hypothetical protein HK103_006812 [Boothiomyces macroporosus]|uniref:Zn(2)-C6 fungal-type domain-containing protein n=1 Tax=Boothiomyces macroporosus TaxID=261099 RepID=A0AAD5UCZ3_9FUNG|nr:hypothetical protein HK103_006812 [Boothiomyces macroporosus]